MEEGAVKVRGFFLEVALEVGALDLNPGVLHAVVDVDPQDHVETGLGTRHHPLQERIRLDFLGAFQVADRAGA